MDKQKALDTLGKVVEAGKRAGIQDNHFICFGLLLGIVREGGPIKGDNDIDMGILAEKVTKEQEDAYYNECKNAGLFKAREKIEKRLDNNRFLWFSLRENEGDCKCCSWFWFEYNGYLFHSKGNIWTAKIGMRLKPMQDKAQAIGKGIRANLLNQLVDIEIAGIKTKIPALYGSCLDEWYPGWITPRNEQSRENILLIIDDWHNKSKWHLMKK